MMSPTRPRTARPAVPILLLSLGACLVACPAETPTLEEPRARGRCPAGFFEADDGRFCAPWIPEERCPPGTMPRLGEDACVPVGPASCPAGFEVDPSGWGCRDVIPGYGCTGATREALGDETCRPVGDCEAPFPPPDADLVVDASLTADVPAEGRFRTVSAALSAAAPGARIAIEAGTYTEALDIDAPVSLIGRCAAQVTLSKPAGSPSGIWVGDPVSVSVRGLTVTGFVGGVVVSGGAEVHVAESVIDGNVWLGLISAGTGTRLTLEDSVVRRTFPGSDDPWGMGVAAYQGGAIALDSVTVADATGVGIYVTSPGTVATVRDTAVLRTRLDGANENNAGIYVQNRGRLEAEGLLLADNHAMGLVMYEPGTEAILSNAVIRHSRLDSEGLNGMGLGAWAGASLTLSDATFVGNHSAALHVQDSVAHVTRTVLRATGIPDQALSIGHRLRRVGLGAVVDGGGHLELESSAAVDSRVYGLLGAGEETRLVVDGSVAIGTTGDTLGVWGSGIGILDGARGEIRRSASLDHDGLALVTAGTGAFTELSDTLLVGLRTDAERAESVGLVVSEGGRTEATRVAVIDFQIAGVLMHGEESHCRFEDGVIAGTRTQGEETGYGFNVGVIEGATLHLVDTEVRDGERTGLAFWGARGVIEGGAVLENQIGLNVEAGTSVREVSGIPEEPVDLEVVVSTDTRFEGNDTNLGAATLPLPEEPLEIH
jgi:hypothetical protein